ncbi:hypothetical protein [Legionella erythra]|nr:hypothetical protein [Legionella erythra]
MTKNNLHKSHYDITGIVWPPQVMQVILALKAESRRGRQLPFYYQVIEYEEDSKGGMDAKKNEALIKFIQFLEKNADKLPPGLRFQLAVLLDGHWTVVDHVVTSKGISCFNLDAVMDKRALRFFRNYILLLDKARVLHASYIYYVNVPEPLFGPTPKEKVEHMIQTDFVSCGIFMADHLSFLSRTHVFHHLKAMAGEPVFKKLGRNDVSPALAPIFRLTQSKHLLRKLTGQQSEAAISKHDKGKTLKSIKQQSLTESIKYNVITKGDKLLENAIVNVKSRSEQEIAPLFANDLITRLTPYVEHYSAVINQLAALIYTRIADCKGMNDQTVIEIMASIHQIMLGKDKDDIKLAAITSLLLNRLPGKDVNSYRLLTASISFTVFHCEDNDALWKFYLDMMKNPVNTGLMHHTHSFFNTPTKLTPSLSTYIDKAVKVQLLLNALKELRQGYDSPLTHLTDEMQKFIKKSRTFDVKATKSERLLQQIILAASEESTLYVIEQELEADKATLLKGFGFESGPLASEHSLKL